MEEGEPILTYCSEVWAPQLMPSRAQALRAPLQVLQNDYFRHLPRRRADCPGPRGARGNPSAPTAARVCGAGSALLACYRAFGG